MQTSVKLEGESITLGQLLKRLDLISSGGQAKFFLQDNPVTVNKVVETRRGRKLYAGDLVFIKGHGEVRLIV